MAIRFLSVIGQKIAQIRDEMLAGRNTKTRVADLLQDVADSGVFVFDPNKPDGYKQDQFAVFEGVLAQAKVPTAMGESPKTAANKWNQYIIGDLSQATENNNLPVSGIVVAQLRALINQGINGLVPNADTLTFGKVKRSPDETAVSNNKTDYVTPFHLQAVANLFSSALQETTEQTLDKALTGGNESAIRPFFQGGAKAILPQKPTNLAGKAVVLGSDNVLYAGETDIVNPPNPLKNFSGGVHYEAVPEQVGPINPQLKNPVDDWLITTRGVSEKILPNDEFIFDPTVINTLQALYYDGGSNTESPLPSWVQLVKGNPSKLVATVTEAVANTAFVTRIKLSNPSGAAAEPDDFLLTLSVPASTCPNYFRLTEQQHQALPIVLLLEYSDKTRSMGGGLSYTVRSYSSKSELLANVTNTAGYSSLDFMRASSAVCNIGDTLYSDNRLEHILDGSNAYWPVEKGFWGFQLVTPTQQTTGSVIVIETNPCGIVVSRETVTLYYN